MLLAVNGAELRPLTGPIWRTITRIVWLRDGSGLAIIGAGADPQEGAQLWFVDFPSGESRRVTNEVSLYDNGLSVGTDANRLLLVQQKQINNLWLAPANDLGKARQLTFTGPNITFGTFAFDWLSQNRIVYAAPTGQNISLMTMNPDGKEVKEITPPGSDAEPSTPADGRFIAFQSSRGGSDQIWRIDPDGGNAKQLTTCGQNYQPSVSPDGRWVVFVSDCNGSNALWRVSSDGDQAKRLTDRAVNWPWFSPDGKWIAGIYRLDSGKTNIAIFSTEGGTPVKLLDLAPRANANYRIRWTPDGSAVVYRGWAQGLWRQNLSGGPPQRIAGIPEEKIGSFGWSHDGTLFGFGRVAQFRDVVMITNSN
jgi:Tol biopolymer transport system component